MTTTCGVLITDGENLLIAHPTNNKHWDIPKGRREPDEDPADAASRELMEETGILVSSDRLRYLGTFDYRSSKRLALYRYDMATMPDPTTLFCASEFERDGTMVREMDGFAVVTIARALEMVYPALRPILGRVLSDAG